MFSGAHKVAARGAGTKMWGARTWGRSNRIPILQIIKKRIQSNFCPYALSSELFFIWGRIERRSIYYRSYFIISYESVLHAFHAYISSGSMTFLIDCVSSWSQW